MNAYIAVCIFNGGDVAVYGPWTTEAEAISFIDADQETDRLENWPDLSMEEYRKAVEWDVNWEVIVLPLSDKFLKEMK